MPSPRWRKRWRAPRRARSPIMLSLNLPQTLILSPRLSPRERRAHKKKACPAQKGGLKSGGTMPKSHPRRNAAEDLNPRFRQVFASRPALFARILEMAVGEARQRDLPALHLQKLRT